MIRRPVWSRFPTVPTSGAIPNSLILPLGPTATAIAYEPRRPPGSIPTALIR